MGWDLAETNAIRGWGGFSPGPAPPTLLPPARGSPAAIPGRLTAPDGSQAAPSVLSPSLEGWRLDGPRDGGGNAGQSHPVLPVTAGSANRLKP